ARRHAARPGPSRASARPSGVAPDPADLAAAGPGARSSAPPPPADPAAAARHGTQHAERGSPAIDWRTPLGWTDPVLLVRRGFRTVFDTLQDRLAATFKPLRGRGRLSESAIEATPREIRIALLEADVALPVVRTFIEAVRERARG